MSTFRVIQKCYFRSIESSTPRVDNGTRLIFDGTRLGAAGRFHASFSARRSCFGDEIAHVCGRS